MLKMLPPALAAIAFVLLAHSPATAASGTAVGVKPDAQAERSDAAETLVVGADIFIGDRVVTGDAGQVQILFSDNTKLVVGPRSALVIEDYLLRDDGSAGNLAVNALSGTFRFVTGGAAKNRYEIKTPTGTIGVRGTAFELTVAGLYSYILLQHGSVVLRPNNGDEVVLEDKCEYGIIAQDGATVVGNTDDVKGDDREMLKEIFLFTTTQQSLMSKFKIDGAERCLRRPTGGSGSGGSISEPGSSSGSSTSTSSGGGKPPSSSSGGSSSSGSNSSSGFNIG